MSSDGSVMANPAKLSSDLFETDRLKTMKGKFISDRPLKSRPFDRLMTLRSENVWKAEGFKTDSAYCPKCE